ncbi:hypothetical protein M427DRAFT_343097 [Gonapodya prolifera JEL478]|uniref:Secreted protein n=1 Tax=Gonapodya prolifera (strain JEL478) TaxID=1344416 RepID=A0A139AVF0_GONPJ|nr:hypothetical protein M427DRAFT_343097 [Gonapodya prolifera JEL478]|eukprot:KXS20708.1 hypothetical protein M427DRAFT_343097 [Gonapodya prolifera JEL478]
MLWGMLRVVALLMAVETEVVLMEMQEEELHSRSRSNPRHTPTSPRNTNPSGRRCDASTCTSRSCSDRRRPVFLHLLHLIMLPRRRHRQFSIKFSCQGERQRPTRGRQERRAGSDQSDVWRDGECRDREFVGCEQVGGTGECVVVRNRKRRTQHRRDLRRARGRDVQRAETVRCAHDFRQWGSADGWAD